MAVAAEGEGDSDRTETKLIAAAREGAALEERREGGVNASDLSG